MATRAGGTTASSSSRPTKASSAGANTTRALARPASRRRSSSSPSAWSARTSPRTSASTRSSTASPGRRRAAWSRRQWGRSRTRCSTPRPSGSACRATSCSAASSATASGSTGRTAPRGASTIPTGTSQGSPTSTASRRSAARCANGRPQGWRPGFGRPFYPELNVDKKVLRNLRMHLEALDDGAGPDVNLMLDLNFNAKTEGYLKILRAIAHFDMFWIQIDTYSAEGLGYIRRQSAHPISSCETLFGLREFMPYFREQAMDVAIIDTVWNGVWQSMKIAALAEAHEVNVAPHNFYGHLCTMMNAH